MRVSNFGQILNSKKSLRLIRGSTYTRVYTVSIFHFQIGFLFSVILSLPSSVFFSLLSISFCFFSIFLSLKHDCCSLLSLCLYFFLFLCHCDCFSFFFSIFLTIFLGRKTANHYKHIPRSFPF